MSVFSGFKQYITALMQDWDVPGLAIAAVQADEVVFQAGYGLRDVENKAAPDVNTVFAIGSSSKAFTSTALGILADEGKLDWDAPVREYMPDFQLQDPYATERMTTLDLLSHRSGLPRHDLMWYGTALSRAEIFAKLRHLQPTKDFRSFMQYQNLMYMTAGYLIERITGQTWEAFTQERIFEPLGMTRSNFSVDVSQTWENIALPYTKPLNADFEYEALERTDFRNIDAIGPAGSINSTVVDMAQWVRLNLNAGKLGDQQIVSEETMQQIHQRHTPIIRQAMMFEILDTHPQIGQASYGLGWFVQGYRGHRWVHHGGSIDGFNAFVSLLPDDGIGVVALANRGGSLPVIMQAAMNVHDRLLGLDSNEIDWNTSFHEFQDKQLGQAKEANNELLESRKQDAPTTHPLDAFAGTYEHVAYGPVTVSVAESGDTLAVSYNGQAFASVEHLHYNVFLLKNKLLPVYMPLNFSVGQTGDIDALSLPIEPSLPPARFLRQPAADAATSEADKAEQVETVGGDG